MRRASTSLNALIDGCASLLLPHTSSLLLAERRTFATHGIGQSGAHTAGLMRFYKNVGIQQVDSKTGYQIMLDTRVLKTPAKRPLVLPTKALALAIAGEWECQKRRIEANTMPLMSLAATAIDEPQPRSIVIETMLHYVATDPIVCRLEPGPVAKKQTAMFDPILAWLQEEIGVAFAPTHSIFGLTLTDDQRAALRNYLYKHSAWELTAGEQLAASCKSVCIALAAIKGRLGLYETLEAARVEEDHQIEEWGLVEGGHDIDIADIKIRVAAPTVFLQLLREE